MRTETAWVRWTLIAAVLAIVAILVVVPVVHIFTVALSGGAGAYWQSLINDSDTRSAIALTLTVVPFALAANVVFGVAAAWAIARYRFPGRSLLIALIDLPFAVSPVVAGLAFVLVFGLQGYLGTRLLDDGYAMVPHVVAFIAAASFSLGFTMLLPSNPAARRGAWRFPRLSIVIGGAAVYAAAYLVQRHFAVWPRYKSLEIIFATPGLVLATAFVTFPFVARELIPVMEAIGPEEELASLSLGASGWQTFRYVTMPNIKRALAYGIILCNARAMGEFGAVYVVSGHIAGQTETMPLRIERLFQEYDLPGSFAVASVLTLLAILTLIAKARFERRHPSPRVIVHSDQRGGR